jgi:hypothetical protein
VPVLTCPFQTIKAQNFEVKAAAYPAAILLPTELAIKPVAGETWHVEGLSLNFTLTSGVLYWATIKETYKALHEKYERLQKSAEFLEEGKVNLASATAESEAARKTSEKVYLAEPTERNFEALQAATVAVYVARQAQQALLHEIEVAIGEEFVLGNEIVQLGRQGIREAIRTPILKTIARMYARQNELVWNSGLDSEAFFTPGEFEYVPVAPPLESIVQNGTWHETFNLHVQFDDPIDFTERENLKLVLELIGPPKLKVVGTGGFEGPELGKIIELSAVQAVVNYSHSMEGEE